LKRPALKLAEFNYQHDWTGLDPLIAIPTTAGTGSEVGRSSVITIEATQRKAVLFHPELLARLVILDPELTRGLPPKLTAATGLDAFTHALSLYLAGVSSALRWDRAGGLHLIVGALPRACRDGHDLEARTQMLVAAAMGAVAFQKDLGATHSLAHPLSTFAGASRHGQRLVSAGRDEVQCPGPSRPLPARWFGLWPGRREGDACGGGSAHDRIG